MTTSRAGSEHTGDGAAPAPRRDDRDGGRAMPSVVYPEEAEDADESQHHGRVSIDIAETLIDYFADRPDVYAWRDLFFYYEEGNPAAVVAPDVFVVFGVPKVVTPPRRIYRLWVEGVPPTVVFEITSVSTRDQDIGHKREVYARLGVAEYSLFDPLGE